MIQSLRKERQRYYGFRKEPMKIEGVDGKPEIQNNENKDRSILKFCLSLWYNYNKIFHL